MLTFPSKRDRWLTVIIWVSALLIAFAAVEISRSSLVIAALLIGLAAFELWVFYGTRYVVSESLLLVRCGPFRWKIRLSSITAVNRSNDPIASPASSLDRLEIHYGDGKCVLVSPLNKDAFLAALEAHQVPQRS